MRQRGLRQQGPRPALHWSRSRKRGGHPHACATPRAPARPRRACAPCRAVIINARSTQGVARPRPRLGAHLLWRRRLRRPRRARRCARPLACCRGAPRPAARPSGRRSTLLRAPVCRGAERCARWRQGDAESLRREARWLSGAGDGGADGAGARTRAVRELLSRGDRWGHTALHAAAGGGAHGGHHAARVVGRGRGRGRLVAPRSPRAPRARLGAGRLSL